jgi:tRNA(adenine34) deaminase
VVAFLMTNDAMKIALKEAQKAYDTDEVPVGAVIVHKDSGEIIATSHNQMRSNKNPTLHAEMIAIQGACAKLNLERLSDYDLYVTLEPCPMCAAAISFARLNALYFGAYDPKGGAVEHNTHYFDQPFAMHKPKIYGGIMEQECNKLLVDFFKVKR